jgi:hypothetical protein
MATLLPKQALYQAELRPDGRKSRVSGWIGQAARGTKCELFRLFGKAVPTIVPTALLGLLLFLSPAAAFDYAPVPPGYAALLDREPSLAYPGAERWRADSGLLRRVNAEVNQMAYEPEEADVWGEGSDCEDYVLLKLRALMAAGAPRGALRIAVADLWGVMHAVLIVNGVYVLDSLTDRIFLVGAYPGTFISTEGAEGWRRSAPPKRLEDLLP